MATRGAAMDTPRTYAYRYAHTTQEETMPICEHCHGIGGYHKPRCPKYDPQRDGAWSPIVRRERPTRKPRTEEDGAR